MLGGGGESVFVRKLAAVRDGSMDNRRQVRFDRVTIDVRSLTLARHSVNQFRLC
jgi:hypothetical protein